MSGTIKKILVYLLLLLVCCYCQTNTGSHQPSVAAKDGAFVHISHRAEDAHRALIALQMAAIMPEDKDVLVYFDMKGIEVVLKDTEDIAFSHFPSSKTQIEKLLSKQVPSKWILVKRRIVKQFYS